MAQQGEAKYINDWLLQFHPTSLQWKRVRLGRLPDKELARMYEVAQRWADAILVEDNTVHIVEAKLENQISGISQLELYLKLFKETPEFSAYIGYPVVLHLVSPFREAEVERMCRERGISYEVYTPAWYRRF